MSEWSASTQPPRTIELSVICGFVPNYRLPNLKSIGPSNLAQAPQEQIFKISCLPVLLPATIPLRPARMHVLDLHQADQKTWFFVLGFPASLPTHLKSFQSYLCYLPFIPVVANFWGMMLLAKREGRSGKRTVLQGITNLLFTKIGEMLIPKMLKQDNSEKRENLRGKLKAANRCQMWESIGAEN